MPPITPERWRALSPYLDEALDLPADARAGWLDAVAVRDAPLAAELGRLLAEHTAVHHAGFLDGALLDPHASFPQGNPGDVLGAYRLISLIGQGGSGSVWLAERCDGRFQGRAAVKLLNPALVARYGEERFRREGSILASLKDPRIAHLIDAGLSPSGQPYLVLEYVDGQPIDRYCEAAPLAVEQRLRLFLDVLEAVAHAHASLVVHRDIKPANVLVDTEGRVKLLDFGIAKLLQQVAVTGGSQARDSSALNRELGKALTPEYAAPEQLSGDPITTATDVYALGVLLFTLLAGRHPAGDAAGTAATLIRNTLLGEVPRLSHAAAALPRALRGDLDAIVGRALQKDPAARYPSVTAFADDIRRLLRHEPVSARPDTLGYRGTRFVRRNAGILAMLVMAAAIIAAITAVHAWRLAAERDRAQREASKALKVSEILTGLLTSADPYAPREGTGEPTVRALLDGGSAQVERELVGQPDLQAEILTMMGRTYRRLGVYDRAEDLLEQALVAGRDAYGGAHVQVAETLHDLGVLYTDTGNYAAAASRLEQALAMQRTLRGSRDPEVAKTLVELGRVYQDEGSNARAEPLLRESLEIRRAALGLEDGETAVSVNGLASVLRLDGDLDGAAALLEQSLALNLRAQGEAHPNTATSRNDLAIIKAIRGDLPAAELLLRQSIGGLRQALGPRHPVLAAVLNNHARVLDRQARYDEAAAALEEAIAIVRPALGPQHQLVAIYSLNLAVVHMHRRRPDLAEPLAREGVAIRALAPGLVPARRRTFLEDDWSLDAATRLLRETLTAQGRDVPVNSPIR